MSIAPVIYYLSVAEFVPSVAGHYVVNADNTVANFDSASNDAVCLAHTKSADGKYSSTLPPTSNIESHWSAAIAATGILFASVGDLVVDYCDADHGAGVTFAEMDGTLVDEVNGSSAAVRPGHARSASSPRQTFRKALAREARFSKH